MSVVVCFGDFDPSETDDSSVLDMSYSGHGGTFE